MLGDVECRAHARRAKVFADAVVLSLCELLLTRHVTSGQIWGTADSKRTPSRDCSSPTALSSSRSQQLTMASVFQPSATVLGDPLRGHSSHILPSAP